MAHVISQPHRRDAAEGRSVRAKNRRRIAVFSSIFSLGLIASMTSATALPHEPDLAGTGGRNVVSTEVATATGTLDVHDGSITITEPGTVIDGMFIRGAINVQADDVTIKNTVVAYRGYHSIRIFPEVVGTRIVQTEIYCLNSHTNGVVFGNYSADSVALYGCRNGFVSSSQRPADITNSTIDGEPSEAERSESESDPSRDPEPSPPVGQGPSSSTDQESGSSTDSGSPDFPDESTTGVPDGTTLTASGSLTITEDGTVVDGLHIRGTITIAADNVTVRNVFVQGGGSLYPIRVESGTTGTLIEHVEIDNLGDTGIGVLMSGGGTIRHANIHSAEDGIRIQADNVTVEYSYIHDLQPYPGGHHDSIQIRKGDDVTIRGNNLQVYVASIDAPMNAAIQIGSLVGSDRISNLLVTGNLMNGGNFTINGGGRNEVDSARYSENQFGRDFRYGTAAHIQHSIWESSNVWADTGQPVR